MNTTENNLGKLRCSSRSLQFKAICSNGPEGWSSPNIMQNN